jgi:hypothetical protein
VREIQLFGCGAVGNCNSGKLGIASATASSFEHSGKTADKAIDGNLGTRWSSQFSNPQWIYVDLGAQRHIDKVILRWENAASADYDIQVGNSPGSWTTVYTDSAGNGGVDEILGLNQTARYVRMYSRARTTQYGNSLWEFEVYGDATASCASCEDEPLALSAAGNSGGWSSPNAASDGIIGPGAPPATKTSAGVEYLEYTLADTFVLSRARIWEDNAGSWNVDDWNVQYWNGSAFVDAFALTNTPTAGWNEVSISGVTTNRVRVRMRDNVKVEVREVQLFGCFLECPLPDTDGDGVKDCTDVCITDPLKTTSRGLCGCDHVESDFDEDESPNCIDECPLDPETQRRGECGCPSDTAAGVPAGTPCDDGVQRGVFECDGNGTCGDPEAGKPHPSCILRYLPKTKSYYWLCSHPVSWAQAQDICNYADGAKIADINSDVENLFLTTHMNASAMWVGANDNDTPGEWYWAGHAEDSGEKFWTGGSAGHRYFARYSNWEGGMPSANDRCGQLTADGRWDAAGCGATAGFICQVGTERIWDHDWPKPKPACEILGQTCPDPNGGGGQFPPANCIPESDAFGGLSESGVIDALAHCQDVCTTFGQGSAECTAACTGPATPPPMGSVCDENDPDFNFPLDTDSCGESTVATPQQACTVSEDCEPNQVCSRHYPGGGEGQPLLCVIPSWDCPGGAPDFPELCQTISICEADVSQTAEDFVESGSSLNSEPLDPEEAFGDPVPAPEEDLFPADDDPCSGPCVVDDTHPHPWCKLEAEDPTPDRDEQRPNKSGGSNGDLISFNFTPDFVLTHDADIGAFGLPSIDLTARAGFSSSIDYTIAGGGHVSIIDISAELTADECGVNSDATFDVFGEDFIAMGDVDEGPYGLPIVLPEASTQQACREAYTAFQEGANKAKKTLRDALELLNQYKALTDDDADGTGNLANNFSDGLCEALLAQPPRGFPTPDCENDTPEDTINDFIRYYQRTVTGFDGVDDAKGLMEAAELFKDGAFAVNEEFMLYSYKNDDRQTIAEVQFFIGPIPVVIEVSSTVSFGANITATANFDVGAVISQMLTADADQEALQVAFIKVAGEPFAGAGMGVFAGVGFGVPGFKARIGLQADLSLGTINVPAFAGAGIGLGSEVDDRGLPSDMDPFDTGTFLIPPKRYILDLHYAAGLGVRLRDVLSGSVNGKLKISVLFFSKTWQKRLLNFEGLCAEDDPETPENCDFNLVSLEGSTDVADGSIPWATIRMPTPFPRLALLDSGAAPTGDTEIDLSTVSEFFYDSLCTCIPPDDGNFLTPPPPECFRDGDCCDEAPTCFPNGNTGRFECVECSKRDGPCNNGAECCGVNSLCNGDTGTCIGLGDCGEECTTDEDCHDGLFCTSGTCVNSHGNCQF